ncbi:MAG: hypothetical protein A2284_12530 [Deltaproteobacteria bacterium RIFOXYA12_FULL_61_11]|nr:MAG: hypothetical protein A2284_12530 [Deltaproteobacteria bacterium RIFOXYA12_FULL_61_11]
MLHVVVTGADGCGKSTLCEKLREALAPASVVVSSPWQTLNLVREAFSLGQVSQQHFVQAYLQSIQATSRLYFLYHAVLAAHQAACREQPDIIISDGYWYKYALFELGFGLEEDKAMLAASLFPQPDLCLYLELDPEEAGRRKQAVSEYESGGTGELQRFLELQRVLRPRWQRLARQPGWHTLPGTLSPEALCDTATALIRPLLG